jgi:hypothetical protein
MSYAGTLVVTPEDFKKEIEKRDSKLLERLSKKLNGRWIAHCLGYDVDYDANPAVGMNE